MKLNRHIVIPLILSCGLITFCLYVYTSSNGNAFIISSSNCRQLFDRRNDAVLNLKNILSIMKKNPTRYNKEITLKLSETVRILSAEMTDESIIKDVTDKSVIDDVADKSVIEDVTDKSINEDVTSVTDLTDVTATNLRSAVDAETTTKMYSPVAKTIAYACPEKFRHAKYGDPYFMSGSWVVEDCGDVKPISKILTVAFVTSEDDPCSVAENKVMSRVLKLYPDLPIVIGVPENSKCAAYKPNIKLVEFPSDTKLGVKLNGLINAVKTPLVLITRSLDDFNWLARLERQLSVFSTEPSAVIVGGSVRNKTGHWQAGCYQTELRQYILKYIEGYYKSKHECMYCEHLMGPFIAQSRLLRVHKFDENLQDDVVFEDFFLGVKQAKPGSILACPDVMYHSTDPGIALRINERETWFSLSAKWGLNRIVLPDGIVHKFSCEESKLNCKWLAGQVGALMMPVCCRDAFINGYKVFHAFSVKHKVLYQIEGGSALGAVKLNDVIPWDFDGDGSYYQDKMDLFSKEMNWTNADGEVYVDHIKFKAAGFFYVSTPDAFIEFWAMPKLSVDAINLTKIFKKTPTLIRIGDAWVYAPPSPGLFARNYYGNEILRHSNSYYHLGKEHWFSPYNVSDPFIKCKVKHHACLDQFLNDGNIQFKIPDG